MKDILQIIFLSSTYSYLDLLLLLLLFFFLFFCCFFFCSKKSLIQKIWTELCSVSEVIWRDLRDLHKPAGIFLFKAAMETTEQCMKSVKSFNDFIDVVLLFLVLTLNRFHTLFMCFHFWLWTSKWRLGTFLKALEKGVTKIWI